MISDSCFRNKVKEMSYTEQEWRDRIKSRTDLCSQVTHLTKSNQVGDNCLSALDILIKILQDRKIIGSTTSSGFIVGNKLAVCFQDAPLYSICQNVEFELKKQKESEKKSPKYVAKYEAYGLMFPKQYVYSKGGRPVIYENTKYAKQMLPEGEWWRIVNYDLSEPNNIIDWSHEREWRVPGDFEFDIEEATVLVMNTIAFKEFMRKTGELDSKIATQIKSIVPLGVIFV